MDFVGSVLFLLTIIMGLAILWEKIHYDLRKIDVECRLSVIRSQREADTRRLRVESLPKPYLGPATWTRPDGQMVYVNANCTTRDQLMAYLDEPPGSGK